VVERRIALVRKVVNYGARWRFVADEVVKSGTVVFHTRFSSFFVLTDFERHEHKQYQ
jgi:hypothetical protein